MDDKKFDSLMSEFVATHAQDKDKMLKKPDRTNTETKTKKVIFPKRAWAFAS